MKKKLKRSILMLFLAIMMITILPTSASAATNKTTPGKVTLTKVSSSAYNKITINWEKTSNATNYVIYYKKSGASKWTKLATVKSTQTSYTHTSSKKYPITVGQNYTYTVRAYNSKSKKYGSYNTKGLTTKTIPSTVKLGKATLNSKKTAVTVTWNKTNSCNYYVIYRKAGSSSKWTKLATVKSSVTKYTDKKPVKGVKNTYTIRSYYSKTKVYGKYNTKGVSVTMPAIKVSKVALNKTSATLKSKGQTVQLTATVSPSNATNKTLEWKSSNTNVATVDSSGKVTAVANGTATITATAKDDSKKSASCKITVSIPSTTVPVSSVSLNKTSATLTAKGQTAQLTATVAPSNATNKVVTWASDNGAVATVNNGVITAVGNGTANITVKTADGGKTATCKVTVNIPVPVTPKPVSVSSVSLNKTSATLTSKGATTTLTATVSPSNADNKSVTWSTDNSAVATVNSSGVVTAVGNGTANITVKTADGGKTATCKVTVSIPVPVSSVSVAPSSVTLTKARETTQLSATVSPSNADNKSVTWSTDNSAVATVNSSGVVTAVANGSCNITARTADGGKTNSCKVTVNIATTPSNPTSISLAGGKSKIIGFGSSDVPTGTDLTKITYEMQGNTNCIEVLSSGYVTLAQKSMFQMKGLKTGSVTIIGKYNGQVLKIWNITVTSNWDVYIAYENWKRGVEQQIWTSNMSGTQKLDAIVTYVKNNFSYSTSGGSGKYSAALGEEPLVDCYGAAGLFADMAKDAGATVGYFNVYTNTVYEYMSDAKAAGGGHICNVVKINGEWVKYDATPFA